jgi:type VI protein secretion system component Hcp
MSNSLERRNGLLAMACLALSLIPVSAQGQPDVLPKRGIYVWIGGITGTVEGCGAKAKVKNPVWITVATLQLGNQTTPSPGWWYITPPPGVQTITLTRNPDASSPGFSAAFAAHRTFPTVIIHLCDLDMKGAPAAPKGYTLHNAQVSSLTVTPGLETVVLRFASLSGYSYPPQVQPVTPSGRAVSTPAFSRVRSLPRPTATPTPRGPRG